jgi:dUTP pyrophosphatase
MVPPKLQIKLLSEHGKAPERASSSAAGYDLFSAVDISIPAKGKQIVATDISLAIPEGFYGRVAPRSGLAVKHFIDVGAGVIDSDYRGPLGVVLFNFGENEFVIKRGDRIAQLIITPIITPPAVVVESLDATSRGQGGFGSTGTSAINTNEVHKS